MSKLTTKKCYFQGVQLKPKVNCEKISFHIGEGVGEGKLSNSIFKFMLSEGIIYLQGVG